MPQEKYYIIFKVAIGWVGILGSSKGLSRITLPQNSELDVLNILGLELEQAELSSDHFRGITKRLKTYFDGCKVEFHDKLDFSGTTHFQRTVWQVVKCLPYGLSL